MSTRAIPVPAQRLILVAHAATAATRRGAFAQGRELPETAALAAAAALAGSLPDVARALVAPSAAAKATASALGCVAEIDARLRDLDVGAWGGCTPADLPAEDLAAWLSDSAWAGHGGESLTALVERAAKVLRAHADSPGATLAVTHAALVRAALVAGLEAPPSAFWRIDVAPLHALVLTGDGRRWAIRRLGPLASVLRASGG